jgi:hypothetical protein
VAIAVTLPVALGARLVDLEDGSSWVFVFLAVGLAGFLAGGFVAGRRAPGYPLTHGAAAAVLGWGLVQAVGTTRRLVSGETVSWIAIVFMGLLAASTGVVGALLSNRRGTLVDDGEPAGWPRLGRPG